PRREIAVLENALNVRWRRADAASRNVESRRLGRDRQEYGRKIRDVAGNDAFNRSHRHMRGNKTDAGPVVAGINVNPRSLFEQWRARVVDRREPDPRRLWNWSRRGCGRTG